MCHIGDDDNMGHMVDMGYIAYKGAMVYLGSLCLTWIAWVNFT